MEDQALHIVGKIGERDLGLGSLDADRADEQGHVRLLLRKDMLDPRAYFGFDPVGSTQGFRSGFAFGLFAVDAADPALRLEPRLIALRAVSSIALRRFPTTLCAVGALRGSAHTSDAVLSVVTTSLSCDPSWRAP